MPLKPGTITPTDYVGSMAEAIEKAFSNEWPKVMGSEAPGSNPQMQLLFIAIAQGVIRHLVDHPEAFVINLGFDGTSFNASVSITPDATLFTLTTG